LTKGHRKEKKSSGQRARRPGRDHLVIEGRHHPGIPGRNHPVIDGRLRRNRQTFTEVAFQDNATQLERVAILLKTVRNNLFHGGKQGSAYWDDPERMRLLLPLSVTVLAELAGLGGFEADYTGYY
jgi:hypothetical protein